MKTIRKLLIVLLVGLFIIPNVKAKEKNQVKLYLFYSSTCPHCAKEKKYLETIKDKYDNLTIYKYEVSEDNNGEISNLVSDSLDDDNQYIPYTIIGTYSLVGFNEYTQDKIEEYIDTCSKYDCYDLVGEVLNQNKSLREETKEAQKSLKEQINEATKNASKKEKKELEEKDNYMKIPLLGKVNVKEVSLPLIAASIGLVDGFNPCAMWVLIFLISMLIGMKNRKRMWIIGFTFLFTSALIYLLFMTAWLSVTVNFSRVRFVQILIALVALIGAYVNFKSFNKERKKDAGCQVVDDKKRKSIINKIKKFTTEKSLFLALIGAASLAISVNIVELACSAGLPLLFTNILALNDLSVPMYALYMIIYMVAFLLDDIIVFTIAMITLKLTGISNKYNKYSHLIGGLIMLIIGVLMMIKPEWIMMNF